MTDLNDDSKKSKYKFVHETKEEWVNRMIKFHTSRGWQLVENSETKLNFDYIEGDSHWMKDYDKKTRSFIQYDGNQIINFKKPKENKNEI